MKEITFVTTNEHKTREMMAMLPSVAITVASINIPEIQGDIESIAVEKAKAASSMLKCNVVVEDTSLVFSAFGDALPGPYIKDFIRHIGVSKVPRLLDSFDDKRATAVCTFSVCTWPELNVELFQGRTMVNTLKSCNIRE